MPPASYVETNFTTTIDITISEYTDYLVLASWSHDIESHAIVDKSSNIGIAPVGIISSLTRTARALCYKLSICFYAIERWIIIKVLIRKFSFSIHIYPSYHSLNSPPGPMKLGLTHALESLDRLLTCSSSTSMPSPGPGIRLMNPSVTFHTSGFVV